MRVIFLKDVPRVGRKYDIKDIASGHVMNFLLPKKLVEIATDKTIARIEKMKELDGTEQKIRAELSAKSASALNGVKITVSGKANEQGHLFAGIHEKEISEAIKKQTRLQIDPEDIKISEPIRGTGEHQIIADLHGVKAEFTLVVESL